MRNSTLLRRRWAVPVAIILVAALGIVIALSTMSRGRSASFTVGNDAMAPTLQNGDTVVIHKWDSAVSGALARGDIIVFRNPANDDVVLLKRLIGLPNDQLLVSNGTVFVNGDRLAEPYVLYPATYTYPPDGQGRTVPAGNYFVLGDNRPNSADSHLGWFVPEANIIGTADMSTLRH